MTPAVCPHCGAPVELDDQRHRAVPTWWQDLFLREKPVGLSETVSNFQTLICPICGCHGQWPDTFARGGSARLPERCPASHPAEHPAKVGEDR